MVVLITNVTDGPGKKPREVRVYNKKLSPGMQIRVDARFVDEKVRKLEEAGFVAIGPVPPWYADYSARRQKRNLSSEQVQQKLQAKKDYEEKRAAAKAAMAKQAPKPAAPAPAPAPVKVELSDSVDSPTDEFLSESEKESKKKRRR